MECVVQVVRGSPLDPKHNHCVFCGTDETVSLFLITKEVKYDGVLLNGFGICKEHLDRLNALLSGEFDIDDIFLEKYRVGHAKKVQLRRYPSVKPRRLRKFPAVNIAVTKNKKTRKQCAFTGCTNMFTGIANKDYCDDPRCVELRNEYFRTIKRVKLKDPDAKNLILSGPQYKRRLKSGQSLKIRCRAKDSLGLRCKNTFLITFDLKQGVYPCFCECHRSAYKRQRFYLQKG
jgi:hypothetical protein